LTTKLNGTYEVIYQVVAKGGTVRREKVILKVLPPPANFTNVTMAPYFNYSLGPDEVSSAGGEQAEVIST